MTAARTGDRPVRPPRPLAVDPTLNRNSKIATQANVDAWERMRERGFVLRGNGSAAAATVTAPAPMTLVREWRCDRLC